MLVFAAPDDLAANLARWEFGRVDIAVGGVRVEGQDLCFAQRVQSRLRL
jgi:hypothetical protein